MRGRLAAVGEVGLERRDDAAECGDDEQGEAHEEAQDDARADREARAERRDRRAGGAHDDEQAEVEGARDDDGHRSELVDRQRTDAQLRAERRHQAAQGDEHGRGEHEQQTGDHEPGERSPHGVVVDEPARDDGQEGCDEEQHREAQNNDLAQREGADAERQTLIIGAFLRRLRRVVLLRCRERPRGLRAIGLARSRAVGLCRSGALRLLPTVLTGAELTGAVLARAVLTRAILTGAVLARGGLGCARCALVRRRRRPPLVVARSGIRHCCSFCGSGWGRPAWPSDERVARGRSA
ncbi:pentapeptide repeat-containing protein [Okibacterium fritillariae]|uniref:pentapeptide repeat-containing protein n=1 Tax=Okibacterium fritillariae TaxID=123320 RepID=UPI0040553F00